MVDQNVGPNRTIASGAPIELFFDRLLRPDTVTRQSIYLADLKGNSFENPRVVYDPVVRSVAIAPLSPLMPCQTFRLYLVLAGDSGTGYGLRALDGAPLAASTPRFIEFTVSGSCTAGDGGSESGAPVPAAPAIDFCGTILPFFTGKCAGPTCHGGPLPAAGLRLDTPQAVVDSAIDRVAEGSNQGPRAGAAPPSSVFGIDMPIIDRAATAEGNPGNSWLVYKMLLGYPPSCPSGPCDTLTNNLHSRPWRRISVAERETLAHYVTGREMPFPTNPGLTQGSPYEPTLDELDEVSFWIQQGAPVPPCP